MRFFSLVRSLFIATLIGGSSLLQADEGPKLTRAEVQAYRDQNLNLWLSKIEKDKTRLFYTDVQWPKEVARILGLKGKGAEWRQLLYDAAVRISASPIPVYIPPDKFPPDTVNVSEEGWQRGYGNQLISLAAAVRIWPEARFRTALRERTLAGCRFETWGRQGKKGELADMDLAAGHMMVGVSIAYDWGRDIFTPEEKAFIRDTMTKRVHRMLEALYGAAFWADWYSQNHNHISVAGLGLAGLAFLEEIPEAPEWLAGAVLNFQRAVVAIAPDGSSYEGVGYWGYGRTAMIEFIEGVKNVADTASLYNAPSLQNAAAFRVACSTPGFNGVLMWADSRGSDVSGPQHLLVRFASQYHLESAQYVAEHIDSAPMAGSWSLPWLVLWYNPSLPATPSRELDYYAPIMDMATTRSGWGEGDYLLSLKSGINRYHHTHLDAGSLSFNFGGTWLLMAPGYGLGLGKPKFFDMNGGRWDYFSASSESHSTLRIGGKLQRYDKEARGTIDHFLSSPSVFWTEVNLREAYENVQAVRRRVLHQRGDYILVLDEVSTSEPTSVEWMAQVPPRAQINGTSLSMDALRGDLTISLLGQAAPFVDYKPTAKFVDVSPNRLKSVASKNTGSAVRLAALFKPHFAGEPVKPLTATFENRAESGHAHIEGADWKDDIWTGTTPEAVPFAEIKNKDGAVAVRRVGKRLVSVTAVAASKLRFAGIEITAESPADIAIEEIAPGIRLVTVGTPFHGATVLPSGVKLLNEKGAAITSGATDYAAGRYWILDEKVTRQSAEASVATLFPPRPAPQPFALAAETSRLADAPASVVVHWEAEESPLQQGGISSIKSFSNASGGKAVDSFGVESSSHSIGWKISVPKDGSYHLRMRYALGQPKGRIALLVDGKVPSKSALALLLVGQAGWGEEKAWSIENHNWVETTLADETEPLRISLTKGEHEIRLAAPTEGMNIDALELVGAASSNPTKVSP